MTPDGWFTILCALAAVLAYVLWVVQRAGRFRMVLAAFAVVSLTLALVLHEIETARIIASVLGSGGGAGGDGPS